MLYASDVIYEARRYLGYTEKDDIDTLFDDDVTGSHNFTKFGLWMDNDYSDFYDAKRNGKPWSVLFIHYCMIKAIGLEGTYRLLRLRPKNNCYSVEAMLNHYRRHHMFSAKPKVGSQVFICNEYDVLFEKTGLVTQVNDTNVVAITADHAGTIEEVSYFFNNKLTKIVGYGHPRYIKPEPDAIKIHIVPPIKTWTWPFIRYNKFDLTATGSIIRQSNGTLKCNPGNGPLVLFVKQDNLPREDWVNDILEPMYSLVSHILTNPVAYDKSIHPWLYYPYVNNNPSNLWILTGTTALQTPLSRILLDVITPYIYHLHYHLTSITYAMGDKDNVRGFQYVKWIKYSFSPTLYMVVIMPAYTYNLHFDDDEAYWDGWLFNKPPGFMTNIKTLSSLQRTFMVPRRSLRSTLPTQAL